MRNLFILLAATVLFGSCNTSYEKTKSGLRYKIIKGKGGNKLKVGDFVKFNQVVAIPERDTVINTTYGKMPGYVKIDTGAGSVYSFVEVLQKMSVGDSAVIIFSVDSLKKKNMIPDYDNTLRRGGQITFKLKVLKSYANEAEVNADYQNDLKAEQDRRQKEAEAASQNEIKELDEYIKKNNIKAVKTPSGAYVEIQNEGLAPKADTGTTAIVYYNGKLLKDGTTFDSNKDPKFNHTQSLNVPIGTGSVIQGFDEGLRMFGKGGKGRIFIPSFIGYGAQGSPPVIPPSATLIFEVEMSDVLPKGQQPPTVVAPK
jgi:FKBP-type peptidyl-prolyl cis-trans isomerase FkpA